MRKGFDGLAVLVQRRRSDQADGQAKRRDRAVHLAGNDG